MKASAPGGVLDAKTQLVTEIDLASNTLIIHVYNPIPQGWLSFELSGLTTPVGLGAAAFEISTWDFGKPDRCYDVVTHRLVNPIDIDYWYAGEAMSPGGSAAMVS